MQFSDTTNKNGIVQRVEMLCSMGDGAITGDATLFKQITGLINQSYYEIWMAGLSVDKNNRLDDYNWTDLPDAPITMVLSQADYTIPVAYVGANVATFVRLKGVYYLLNGNKQYLEQLSGSESLTTITGEPYAYYLNGKSIIFDRPFNAATLTKYAQIVTAGSFVVGSRYTILSVGTTDFTLIGAASNTVGVSFIATGAGTGTGTATISTFHVEFQRTIDAFTSADTTQQPSLMETYHDMIPLKASALYLQPIDINLANQYDAMFYRRLQLFKRDIVMFDDNSPKAITSEPVNPY